MNFNYQKHIQSFFASAGKYGCNALCIIQIANDYLKSKNEGVWNEIDALVDGINRKYIDFNVENFDDTNNFFVRDGSGFMTYLTGRRFTMQKESADYQAKKDEYEILFWALSQKNADAGIGHFTLPGRNTLQASKTVSTGKVYSKRVYRLV